MKTLIRIAFTGLVVLASHWARADPVRETAKPGEDESAARDPLMIRALARLEKKLGIHFTLPFPADLDTDAYRNRPLALIPLDGKKVLATRST